MNTTELIRAISGQQLGATAEKQIAQAVEVARRIIESLARVNSNKAFHEWRTQALLELSLKTKDLASTYQAIAVSVAYEQYKARAEFFLVRWFRALWGAITRVGLGNFVTKYGSDLLSDALITIQGALAAQNNADLKKVRDEAFAVLREEYGNAKDNWIAMIIDAAFGILAARGAKI